MERARPPEDITPLDFFSQWVPAAVATDARRRRKLGTTDATIVFELEGLEGEGGVFSIRVSGGEVRGQAGAEASPDLRVVLDVATWRELNRGTLAAPEALLRRRLRLEGDFVLGLKLHLILG